MNKNLTMSIDEKLLKKAKKVAIDHNTTLTGMIREYLKNITEKENFEKEKIINELDSLFQNSNAKVGKKDWTRDDLYR